MRPVCGGAGEGGGVGYWRGGGLGLGLGGVDLLEAQFPFMILICKPVCSFPPVVYIIFGYEVATQYKQVFLVRLCHINR